MLVVFVPCLPPVSISLSLIPPPFIIALITVRRGPLWLFPQMVLPVSPCPVPVSTRPPSLLILRIKFLSSFPSIMV